MNTVTLSGRIASDVVKQTAAGKDVTKFRLAVQNPYRKNAEGKPLVNFFDVVAWDQPATFIARSLAKGDGLIIRGELDTETWDQDGTTRSRTIVKGQQAEAMGTAKPVESVEGPVNS